MGFGQAISSGFNNITNFEGRSSRPVESRVVVYDGHRVIGCRGRG